MTHTKDTINEIEKAANAISKSYFRRVHHQGVQYDDLLQQSRLLALESLGTYDASYGASISTYAYRACAFNLAHHLWATTYILSLPKHLTKPGSKFQKAKREGLGCLESRTEDPIQDFEIRQVQAHIQDRVRVLLDDKRNTHKLAYPVLTGEMTASQVAAANDRPPKDVYLAVQRAKNTLKKDPVIQELRKCL